MVDTSVASPLSTDHTGSKNPSSRLVFIDLLNIAACFGVVALHCSDAVFRFEISRPWLFSMLVQAVFHWPVPIFFMIMGVTLLNYREKYTTAIYFKRRFLRTVIPFFIWSALTLAYRVYRGKVTITGPRQFVNLFLNNEINGIFWFFFAMFAVYLAMPYLSLLAKEKYKRIIGYFLLLYFITQAIFPIMRYFGVKISGDLHIPGTIGYTPYVFLGWMLFHTPLSRKMRLLIYGAGVLGAALMFFGTIWLNLRDGGEPLNRLLMSYNGICTVPLSIAVFVAFQQIKWQPGTFWKKVIQLLSGASFGVYLTQMFVIWELTGTYHINNHSCRYIVLASLGVYALCALFVILMKKIPVVGKILFP